MNKDRNRITRALAIMLMVCLLSPALLAAQDESDTYVVITHKGAQVDTVSREDLRQIFLGKKNVLDKIRITKLVILNDGSIQEQFIRDITGKSPSTFRNYWKRLVFTGKGSMPVTVETEQEVLAYIQNNPGAIGFVSAGMQTDNSIVRMAVSGGK